MLHVTFLGAASTFNSRYFIETCIFKPCYFRACHSLPVAMLPLVLVLLLMRAYAQPAGDEVLSLPGWAGPLPSRMWSGYLNGTGGARIHYRFVESEAGADAPIVSWHNGGPPCSSEIGGFLEVGPLSMGGDGVLRLWDSRWSRTAHLLILEVPPGVGYSYIPGAAMPYAIDDNTMAAHSHAALRSFFAAFPLFASASGLWLAGESYAGVYVPMLAAAVLKDPVGIMPLRGILVGNGAIATGDWYEGGLVQQRAQHAFNHGLVSPPTWAAISAACGANWTLRSDACNAQLAIMATEMGPLNSYNIEVTCAAGASAGASSALVDVRGPGGALDAGADPCSAADEGLTAWMNTPAVQAALHVTDGAAALGAWAECASGANVQYTRLPQDETQSVYPSLLKALDVLIYNGDQDECIPYLQDVAWTARMGYDTKAAWAPWFVNQEVAGYVTEFDAPRRFTFATVKRAGHEVPMYQPERALAMLQRFVAGQSL